MSGLQKVAAITGAAQGIGRRTAELLASRGYHIAILDLQQPTATIAAIEAAGGSAFALAGDITEEAVVDSFAQQVLATLGPRRRPRQQRRHQPHLPRRANQSRRLPPRP
jgi:NAD(P)-dependent dehydrogenase (short-subunit alcohol dehydrogenase family)